MAKKPKIPEHENMERWMVSYADFMTLLFALFVVLYGFAMNSKNEANAMVQGLMDSFSQMGLISTTTGFADDKKIIATEFLTTALASSTVANPSLIQPESKGGGGMLDMGRPKDNSVGLKSSEVSGEESRSDVEESIKSEPGNYQMGAPFDTIRDDINRSLEDLESKGMVTVTKQENWITIELNDALVFAPYSASVLNRAQPILARIGEILKPLSNYIRVRGYTDNELVHDEVYANNWYLSATRSISVIDALAKAGIDPHRMAIEAYAQYAPFVSNSTAKGRSRNRCVVIAVSKYAFKPKKLLVLPDDEVDVSGANGVKKKDLENLEVMRTNDGRLVVYTREGQEALKQKEAEKKANEATPQVGAEVEAPSATSREPSAISTETDATSAEANATSPATSTSSNEVANQG